MRPLDIVGLCGSLRSRSYNAMALRLAGELMPPTMQLEIAGIRDIPLFDADVLEQGEPRAVTILKDRLRRADGILIATPEYNFSVPGMLKNAIDWVSRGDDQPLALKPVALLSATTGPLGGARVQYDLRKILLFLNSMVLAKPEIFIGACATKFDADGRCVDEATQNFVRTQMQALASWIAGVHRFRGEDRSALTA